MTSNLPCKKTEKGYNNKNIRIGQLYMKTRKVPKIPVEIKKLQETNDHNLNTGRTDTY